MLFDYIESFTIDDANARLFLLNSLVILSAMLLISLWVVNAESASFLIFPVEQVSDGGSCFSSISIQKPKHSLAFNIMGMRSA